MKVSMRVVGSGDDLEELRAEVLKRGLDNTVTMDGRLEGERLCQAYHSASVFVFPTSWPEGFPTDLLEAMWAGAPLSRLARAEPATCSKRARMPPI